MSPFLLKQYFQPTPLFGMLFNPFYIARRALWKTIRKLGHHIQGRTLDVGCGSKPYQHCFQSSEYIGMEIDTAQNRTLQKADIFYDGKKFPFEDESFDSVVCFQVLEHVFEPNLFLQEIVRVLKPGGKLLLSVPFVWDEHEQPYDYARYTSFGIQYLLTQNGIEILEHHKTVQNAGVLLQLVAEYLYKLSASHKITKYLTMLLLIFPIFLLGSVFSLLIPPNPDLYLDHVILARKKMANSA